MDDHESDYDVRLTVPTSIDASDEPDEISGTLLIKDEDGTVIFEKVLKRALLGRVTAKKHYDYDLKRTVFLITIPVDDPKPGEPDAYTLTVPLAENVPGEH